MMSNRRFYLCVLIFGNKHLDFRLCAFKQSNYSVFVFFIYSHMDYGVMLSYTDRNKGKGEAP